jgi:hypothetical protein
MDTETEGQRILRLLEEAVLLGCMEGDGNLSINYKDHLWGSSQENDDGWKPEYIVTAADEIVLPSREKIYER